MKRSELIALLQQQIAECGDGDVVVHVLIFPDPDQREIHGVFTSTDLALDKVKSEYRASWYYTSDYKLNEYDCW